MPEGTEGNRGRPGRSGAGRDGFTLVETLAALGICAGLAATVAATAGVCARCEERAEAMSAAARRTMRLYAAARAGEESELAEEDGSGAWPVERERRDSAAFRDNRWRMPRWRWSAAEPGRGGERLAVEVAGMPEEP